MDIEELRANEAKEAVLKADHFAEAASWIVAYQSRLYDEQNYSADAAYKMAKLHVDFAQAEQLTRIADYLSNMDNNAVAIAKAIYSNNPYN